MIDMGDNTLAPDLAEDMLEKLSTKTWYSTQSIGYSLMSIGRYLTDYAINPNPISGTIVFDKKSLPFEIDKISTTLTIPNTVNDFKILLDQPSTTPIYANYTWEGQLKKKQYITKASDLDVKVEYYNEKGQSFSPLETKQNTSFYAVYTVFNHTEHTINDIALQQILPSGWEIENLRLNDSALPSWTKTLALGQQDYLDIRDDRITWFFNMPSTKLRHNTLRNQFIVKLNAITAGDYYLPGPTIEAMYNDSYLSIKAPSSVRVKSTLIFLRPII